jgi:hypothetical protein
MLSAYHERYLKRSDEEIAHRLKVKELQLRQMFVSLGIPAFVSPTIRLAVLGCGDRRFVVGQRRIFETILSKPVEITTFDSLVEHLQGETNVIQHDVTEPVPGGPFDIVYADVLARFIDPSRQYAMLKNAYDALAPGGMAIVTFGKEDYDPPPDYQPVPGTWRVDVNALQFELAKDKIGYLEVPTSIETIPPGLDHKIIIEDLIVVLRKL